MSWGSYWDGWGQDHGWWGKDQGWKAGRGTGWKKPSGSVEDRFANVTTLGLKHPVPLEDRRELVLGLLNRLRDDVQGGRGRARRKLQDRSSVVGARAAPCCFVLPLQGKARHASPNTPQ